MFPPELSSNTHTHPQAAAALDQWKADNTVRLVELKAAEAAAEARLEELREAGDTQRRSWQDTVRPPACGAVGCFKQRFRRGVQSIYRGLIEN
jgi:multidrug resistance efflux pump